MQKNAHEGPVPCLELLDVVVKLLDGHPSELQRVVGVVQRSLVVVDVGGSGVVERLRVVVPRGWEAERLHQFLGHGVGAVSLESDNF